MAVGIILLVIAMVFALIVVLVVFKSIKAPDKSARAHHHEEERWHKLHPQGPHDKGQKH